jgi:hypothetical protein
MNRLRLLRRQDNMINMSYDNITAESCVTIAGSSIDAIYIYLSSQVQRPTDRWSSVLYLVGALLPLVCIIVKNDIVQKTRADAIEAFKKGLSLLNSMSPNFSWARHTLRRIHRIVGTAKRAIQIFDNAGLFSLDPREFVETDTQVPQITDFFNPDNWVNMDKDIFNQPQMGINSMFSFNDVTDPSFPSTADEMDAFWVEDFLNNRRVVFPGNG